MQAEPEKGWIGEWGKEGESGEDHLALEPVRCSTSRDGLGPPDVGHKLPTAYAAGWSVLCRQTPRSRPDRGAAQLAPGDSPEAPFPGAAALG